MLNIVERLDRNKFSPAICVARKGGELDKTVEKLGIPFFEEPFQISAVPYLTLPVRAWQAAQIFKPYKFRLWHSFHYADDYTEAMIAKFSGAKWIYTKKNMNWHSKAWFFRTFFAAGVAVQNTDMMKDFFGEKFKKKAKLVPRGVDLKRFRAVPAQNYFKEKFGVPQDAISAGCAAQLLPVKGHSTLLEAAAKISGLHLFLAGKQDDQEHSLYLKNLALKLGIQERVHFLGDVKDLPSFWAEIDLCVLPTWAKWRMEGCPVALLEAMACGKACIATDIPGSRDIIENGKNGLLVAPENPDALAEAIRELSVSAPLRQKLGEAARKRIEEKFSIDREVGAHESLYSELLNS